MRELGPTIANLRKEREMGQKELAAIMNLSVGTISNYENGVHSPDLTTLCKLAAFFETTTDYLLGQTEYRCPPEALTEYFTDDCTLQEAVNTIRSFDPEKRRQVMAYLDFLKHSQRGQ